MRTTIAAAAAPGLPVPTRAIRERIDVRNVVRVLLCAFALIRAMRSRLRGAEFSMGLLCALGTGLGGCLPVPGNLPPQHFYVLKDLAAPGSAQPATKSARALLVNPTATSPFYDTQSLAYSRAAGQRAYYQFAGWTERPGRRFSELLMRRLEARGAFASVASTTAGVKGDLILNTRIEELYQDASATPGRVQVEVTAELIDHGEHALIARRTFATSAATGEDNAAAAVNAFNEAITALLDEVAAWAEAAAAGSQPR